MADTHGPGPGPNPPNFPEGEPGPRKERPGEIIPGETTTGGGQPGTVDEAPPVSRVKSAGKAIGCLILALLVFGIAVIVGVFDLIF